MGSGSSKDIKKDKGLYIKKIIHWYNIANIISLKKYKVIIFIEYIRRRQQQEGILNRYPQRGQGLSPPRRVDNRSYQPPRPHYDRDIPHAGTHSTYSMKPVSYRDNSDFNTASRSMEDMHRKSSLEESPSEKRLTASEERLSDIHKQWEKLGNRFHVITRVRPMTVREIKESAKVKARCIQYLLLLNDIISENTDIKS